MEWRIFKADKKRKKWSIRGTLFNGIDVKIPGHRDKLIADEMRRNIERLNRAKATSDLAPPEVLRWLENLPEEFVDLLVMHGLVDRRRLDRRLPPERFLPEFEQHLRGNVRKPNSKFPKSATNKVRRIFSAIEGLHSFQDLSVDAVKKAVSEMVVLQGNRVDEPFSVKTVREHYGAIKQFCEWMKQKGSTTVNPIDALILPSSRDNRVRNRRPLEYEEFNKLMMHLQTASPYPDQKFQWTGRDRALLYWAAVTTGFRQSELRSLTRTHFDFDVSPATVTVYAADAKNGSRETIPIPQEFADAIREYTAHHLPDTPVFRTPRNGYAITLALYRDLQGAGVEHQHKNGDIVDFHTFRSTAICWWLLGGMNLLQVQFLARLKTLDLIQEYVRRYVPNYANLVANAPKIAAPRFDDRRSG